MENISAENQVIKNQLMAINSQTAYSYYYNPYVGYSAGTSAGGWQLATLQNPRGTNTGGWQQATPYYPQGVRTTYSPVAPMQPLFTPGDKPAANERRTQQRHTIPESEARRRITPTRYSTPDLLPPPEGPIPQGTMNVEDMMRSIMSEEMRTLEAQMEQRFSYQIHKATTSKPGFDDLARGVREMPFTKRIINTITPKFGSISFPRFDRMSDPHDHLLQWFCNLPPEFIDSFDELSLEFMRSYSVHIQSGKTTKALWGVVQGPHESLRAYIKRFSKAISEISGLDDGTAREALKKGLRHKESSKRDHKRPLSPPKYVLGISPSELIAHLKRQDFVTWPKKLPENPARDTTKYCEFHKDHGQQTIDCRALRAEVTELGETVTAVKSHRRNATQPIAMILPDDPIEHSITFHSSEATSLSRPHDDALVLTLNVSNCEVGRILVDNGSSADVLFLSTLREMELSELDIESSTTVLTGFNGESTTAIAYSN
ncbi:hypothetical protein TIFTF001_039030 [Ficus carica]|uniref:Retrotransposon gag domain-containing protein n=1 Tax=Ficus carica TaxID=3494 RepID=A0AA88EBM1_FICCA|nr:hypothetical protein TIFTF001_039030 [Ficus carica]